MAVAHGRELYSPSTPIVLMKKDVLREEQKEYAVYEMEKPQHWTVVLLQGILVMKAASS